MNDQQRNAMQMALEALDVATTFFASDRIEVLNAQAALREALAQSTNSCQNSTKLVETQPQGELVGYWNGKETAWFEHELCGHPAPDDCTIPLYTTPPVVPQGEPVVYYAYATINEYEELAGFSVSEAFRAGWNMARTTNSMLGINAAPVSAPKQEPVAWKETVRALTDQVAALVWERDELQKHCPDLYESWAAHKANKDVEEFLDSQYQMNYNDDCDYWKGECND